MSLYNYTNYREDVYMHSSAVSHSNGSLLNSYCVEAVCYNNSFDSIMFTPEDCSGGSCVSEQLRPTVPDVDNHWFFSYALFICGSIHSLLSFLMLILFIILNHRHHCYHLRRICRIQWHHIKRAFCKYVCKVVHTYVIKVTNLS